MYVPITLIIHRASGYGLNTSDFSMKSGVFFSLVVSVFGVSGGVTLSLWVFLKAHTRHKCDKIVILFFSSDKIMK